MQFYYFHKIFWGANGPEVFGFGGENFPGRTSRSGTVQGFKKGLEIFIMYVPRSGMVGRSTGPDIHDKKMLQVGRG